ncbi:hypothetical protein IIC65_03630 [Candidatus Sumerlaeota bacterium]|nr:hypothetical protein [Candidatus Sumerlaeota bacterium]
MKMPRIPPDLTKLQKEIFDDVEVFTKILADASGPLAAGQYLHWDKLVHRVRPRG